MKEVYRSSTIQKALYILNLFKDQTSLSLADIQKKLGFHKATLYRVLSTLQDNEYLKKNENGRYELGLNIFILGHRISNEHQLIKIAAPFMEELSRSLGLTIHLGILEGTKVIIIHKSEPDRLIRMSCQVGGALPAHCTSQGKTLLAFSSKETVQKIIDAHGLQRYTPHTICTTEGLMSELEAVRDRGYAIDNGEHEKNIRCLAVPLFNRGGKIEAALSAAGTNIDLPDEKDIQKTIDRLREAREKIGTEMGY